jgi:hypothetical protein
MIVDSASDIYVRDGAIFSEDLTSLTSAAVFAI